MQHDYVIDNQAGAAFRGDLNNALAAIVSLNSGATAPATTCPYMLWYDTTANMLKMRNSADSGWISNAGFLGATGGSITGTLNHASTKTVASAATTDLGTQASNNVDISGTTTITSFGTASEGILKWGRFIGSLTLTHNATSLILPGGANIVTAANDRYVAKSLGSGNWIILDYVPASGQPISTVSIAKGGTGQTTPAGAFSAIKQAASESASGVMEIATSAEVATGTDALRAVPPAYMHMHPSACKAWLSFDGTTGSIYSSQGVSSVTRNSAGNYTVNFSFSFLNTLYALTGIAQDDDGVGGLILTRHPGDTRTTSSCQIRTVTGDNAVHVDSSYITLAFFGYR